MGYPVTVAPNMSHSPGGETPQNPSCFLNKVIIFLSIFFIPTQSCNNLKSIALGDGGIRNVMLNRAHGSKNLTLIVSGNNPHSYQFLHPVQSGIPVQLDGARGGFDH